MDDDDDDMDERPGKKKSSAKDMEGRIKWKEKPDKPKPSTQLSRFDRGSNLHLVWMLQRRAKARTPTAVMTARYALSDVLSL